METKTIQHLNPVWNEKADFIIMATFPDPLVSGALAREQLWSKKISDVSFEICCIPFFLYNLSLGDEVITDSNYIITEVKNRSGHFTFRVWFGVSDSPTIREHVMKEVERQRCLFEWYSNNLLGIDASTQGLAEDISAYLLKNQQAGLLVYETGQI